MIIIVVLVLLVGARQNERPSQRDQNERKVETLGSNGRELRKSVRSIDLALRRDRERETRARKLPSRIQIQSGEPVSCWLAFFYVLARERVRFNVESIARWLAGSLARVQQHRAKRPTNLNASRYYLLHR